MDEFPSPAQWAAFIAVALGAAAVGPMCAPSRMGWSLLLGGVVMALGCGLVWGRSQLVASQGLKRPVVTALAPTPDLLITGPDSISRWFEGRTHPGFRRRPYSRL